VNPRIILVRHGVTDWNREGRFQGHQDPSLAAEGREEAQLLAARLTASAADRPARILSSPLSRALETAQVILGALNDSLLEIEPDPRLMELGQGEWEGRTHAELRVEDAERYALWRAAPPHRQPPGGEPIADGIARVKGAIGEAIALSELTNAWPLCVVSHGGSLHLAAHILLEIALDRVWHMEMDNASISILARDDGAPWQLVTWNDTSHLLGRVTVHVAEEDGEALAL
jgi:broad specificity phosphatase PhoE